MHERPPTRISSSIIDLIDLIDELALRAFYPPYQIETRGAPPFEPPMTLNLSPDRYCIGIVSSLTITLA
ncbi:MAG: hypothetical protein ACFCD0_06085 [Gemmataceae bacterium]